MSYTIPDIITWAKMSQAYASRGEAQQQALTGKGDVDLDVKLYIERKTLEWQYAQDPTSDTTFTVGNWVWALCGVWGLKAQFADSGSGGTITPVTPPSTARPEQLNFTVAASGTTFIDGQTSVLLSTFRGWNVTLDKNGQPMTQISTAPIYYTWDRDSAILTLNLAAVTGDEFQITPV